MTDVTVIARTAAKNSELIAAFARNSLGYEGVPFAGLLSPSSTLIPQSAADKVRSHLLGVDAYVTGILRIYSDLLAAGDPEHPMLKMLEWGLDDHSRVLQRASTVRQDRPLVGRLDCVDLGSNNFIAEVQWKGAGEGWTAAIDRSYREVFPLEPAQAGLGDLVEGWAETFDGDGCAVNTGRTGWMDTETFLIRSLRDRGVDLVSCTPAQVQDLIRPKGAGFLVLRDGRSTPLHRLYLDRLTEVIKPNLLNRLVEAYVAGELVLDPPPSYLFNEKLPLSLPFSGEYESYFDDSVRQALIPTVLLGTAPSTLAVLAPYVRHPERDRLGDVRTWEEVRALPESLRAQIVAKCGSADQYDNHGGHGVFRLSDHGASGRGALERILDRVREHREPWVLQPYLGNTWTVPITHLSHPGAVRDKVLHAKFGVYFRLASGGVPALLGGIATMGTSWKVSGASKGAAQIDASGNYVGAFRHDIRVSLDH